MPRLQIVGDAHRNKTEDQGLDKAVKFPVAKPVATQRKRDAESS